VVLGGRKKARVQIAQRGDWNVAMLGGRACVPEGNGVPGETFTVGRWGMQDVLSVCRKKELEPKGCHARANSMGQRKSQLVPTTGPLLENERDGEGSSRVQKGAKFDDCTGNCREEGVKKILLQKDQFLVLFFKMHKGGGSGGGEKKPVNVRGTLGSVPLGERVGIGERGEPGDQKGGFDWGVNLTVETCF